MQKCQLCGRWFKGKKADHVCNTDCDYEERECVICHTMFIPVGNNQTCCSESCLKAKKSLDGAERVRRFREKAKEAMETRFCAICAREFTPRSPHQLVCEKQSCRTEYKRRYDAARYKGDFIPASWYGQFCMPDPYQGKKLYFDGLHNVRGSMPGRAADPVLGF